MRDSYLKGYKTALAHYKLAAPSILNNVIASSPVGAPGAAPKPQQVPGRSPSINAPVAHQAQNSFVL